MRKHKHDFIAWSDTFACGIKIIDDQHRELIDLINDMYSHVSSDEEMERKFFFKIANGAVRYIRVHFATEEKIMLAANFSGYKEHKMIHDEFVKTVTDSILAFSAGKRLSLHFLTRFLKDWVLSHIAVKDKQYFYHLRRSATRKANGKLSIRFADLKSA